MLRRRRGRRDPAALVETGTAGCSGYQDWAQGNLGPVLTTDSGFVMLTSSHAADWNSKLVCEPVLWTSTDGDQWQLISTESPFGRGAYVEAGPGALASRDGRFVLMGGTSDTNGVLWWSDDGLNWQRADLDLAPVGTIAAGEFGWMIIGATDLTGSTGATWYSTDGRTWDGPHPLPDHLRFGPVPTQLAIGRDTIFGIGETAVIGRS